MARKKFRVAIDGEYVLNGHGKPREFPSENKTYDHIWAATVNERVRVYVDDGRG